MMIDVASLVTSAVTVVESIQGVLTAIKGGAHVYQALTRRQKTQVDEFFTESQSIVSRLRSSQQRAKAALDRLLGSVYGFHERFLNWINGLRGTLPGVWSWHLNRQIDQVVQAQLKGGRLIDAFLDLGLAAANSRRAARITYHQTIQAISGNKAITYCRIVRVNPERTIELYWHWRLGFHHHYYFHESNLQYVEGHLEIYRTVGEQTYWVLEKPIRALAELQKHLDLVPITPNNPDRTVNQLPDPGIQVFLDLDGSIWCYPKDYDRLSS